MMVCVHLLGNLTTVSMFLFASAMVVVGMASGAVIGGLISMLSYEYKHREVILGVCVGSGAVIGLLAATQTEVNLEANMIA